MSKFFEDVGEVFALPVKTVYNAVTNNPKGNSIGDIWNNTVGPGNPVENLVSDNPLGQLVNKAGLGDWSKAFEAPTWDTMQTPMAAFSEHVNTFNKVLPEFVQPYAQPLETAALSIVNPFAGAAFQTAYNAGNNQAQPGSFDWGAFGKDAAMNFGTAAVASGANKLISNANTANAAKTFNPGPSGFENSAHLIGSADKIGTSALDKFGQLGTTAATPGFAAGAAASAANAAEAGANAIPSLASAGVNSSLSSFKPNFGQSTSALPSANALQSSGVGFADQAYKAAVRGGQGLATNTLAETLAPTQNQPISGGALDGFGGDGGTSLYQPQWGDVLNAFGGGELNTPNASGNRIDQTAFDQMQQRLAANTYLQQTQARDQALPAGQFEAPLNTPYANRLDEITGGANQSAKDLADQVNNANRYYSLIDANPGLTSDQLDKFLGDTSTGVLGNFRVPTDQLDMFKGLRTLGPQNMSLL